VSEFSFAGVTDEIAATAKRIAVQLDTYGFAIVDRKVVNGYLLQGVLSRFAEAGKEAGHIPVIIYMSDKSKGAFYFRLPQRLRYRLLIAALDLSRIKCYLDRSEAKIFAVSGDLRYYGQGRDELITVVNILKANSAALKQHAPPRKRNQ
jgi:hypothetical protein